ncbi:hypothetical protein [Kitasatospora sp. NE20-6]|uniref:hypothetical protein n=1 Tax=Kitasatospora sp. NE20-6 TaxID=2859066 RepID=UPI0038B29A61
MHGIWNRQRGMTADLAATALADAALPKLARGLQAAQLPHTPLPALAMAYYADLLTDGAELQSAGEDGLEGLSDSELAQAWQWLLAAGAPGLQESQAGWLSPVRQGLGWLVRQHGGDLRTSRAREEAMVRLERLVCALIREVDAYTSRPQVRKAVRERVREAIRAHRPQVVVAHSLGSVVAWETLCASPELDVELLVTLGSPLGLPALTQRLEPPLRHGKGLRPAGVRRWVNIADGGDLVALPPELGGIFPVDTHMTTGIGPFDLHTLGGYLSNGMAAAAMAPYLSS